MVTRQIFGVEQALTSNPNLIYMSTYVSLIGGAVLILSVLSLIYGKKEPTKQRSAVNLETDRKALLQIGLTAILLAGLLGPLLAIVISFTLRVITPLFFTNFITALFLGNSIILGFLARIKLKHKNKEFSYFRFVKENLKTPSFKVDTILGLIGAVAFIILLSLTLVVIQPPLFQLHQ